MRRVAFQTLYDEFYCALTAVGFSDQRAALCAKLFAENQRDGVYSHGLNRFPGFVESMKQKKVDFSASPEKVKSLGALEQWDGKRGVGLINAHACMQRAIELAQQHGMGGVGLKNTNHWMRAGAYALQAADNNCIGICWTNTTPLMPPWGSAEKKIGNNPVAFAIPRDRGHILLDMAMSQYSNGKLEVLRRQGQQLPLPGGYDNQGKLTQNPGDILESRRALPIGYWKGSGLALMLDMIATVVSGGQSTHQIGNQGTEHSVSQVFIAFDTTKLMGQNVLNETIDTIIQDFHTAAPLDEDKSVRYPGEGMLRSRKESLEKGVLVDEEQWKELLNMYKE